MKSKMEKYCIVFMILVIAACKEPYDPPVINVNNNFLVVEGMITPDSTTIFLSRTRNLGDATTLIPQLNAVIFVQSERGEIYPVQSKLNGTYATGKLQLDLTDRYRVRILVSGSDYLSDFVELKQTPPIDSLSWELDKDVFIYVHAHDPANNTWFYRWEFSETWEHHTYYDTNLGYANGQIYFRDSSQLLTTCWQTIPSKEILLGTSARLSQDVINRFPITSIPDGSEKISVRYSILVRQYGMTKEDFEFWQLLKKNSNQLGTLFDAQPSELKGNIRNVTRPEEPVIGYVSACIPREKRIFIRRNELAAWHETNQDFTCSAKLITPDSVTYYLRDTTLSPAYFVSGGNLAIAKNICVDCTWKGGKTAKPSFW